MAKIYYIYRRSDAQKSSVNRTRQIEDRIRELLSESVKPREPISEQMLERLEHIADRLETASCDDKA